MTLAALAVTPTAWATSPHARIRLDARAATPVALTYNVSEDFCARIKPRFVEDAVLSWDVLGCGDVRMMVRQAFDAWEHNSLVSFVQTDGPASVVVAVSDGREDNQLGWAIVGADTTSISVSDDFCWYTDRVFCDSVRDLYVPLLVGMAATWAAALYVLVHACRHPASSAFDATTRIVAWTVLLSNPLALFAMFPCLVCYDFLTVLIHEVGHGLGLVHSDDESATRSCGCKNETRACAASEENVMHSAFRHRASACLSRDDVDAVRTLWGGDCDDPVWCYASRSLSGFYRLHTSLVYSFAVAWTVVFARNRIARCLRTRAARRVTTTSKGRAPPRRVGPSDAAGEPASPQRRRVLYTSEGAVLAT